MKIEYSKKADALYVYFKEKFVSSSREIEEGIVLDFDENNQIIGIEILDASERFGKSNIANINIENLAEVLE
ncbi:MAG: DUF2283 domain-containing protein [Bacteroidetes bacterium]|nr:DUF2283 domain-containing protein [Bacteroidota bacterium]